MGITYNKVEEADRMENLGTSYMDFEIFLRKCFLIPQYGYQKFPLSDIDSKYLYGKKLVCQTDWRIVEGRHPAQEFSIHWIGLHFQLVGKWPNGFGTSFGI